MLRPRADAWGRYAFVNVKTRFLASRPVLLPFFGYNRHMAKRKSRASSQSGQTAGVVRLGEVLPQLIARYGLQRRKDVEGLAEAWHEAVGEPYAARTRVVGLTRGTLEIAVPHGAFVQELSFRRAELLAAMQAATVGEQVKKIKFVVG